MARDEAYPYAGWVPDEEQKEWLGIPPGYVRFDPPRKPKRKYKPRVRKQPVPFLTRLVQMFEEEPEFIEWRDGDIIIPDPKQLEKKLPTYFRHSNYNSFLRQLNNFGFNKVEVPNAPYILYVKVQGEKVTDIQGLLALRPRERNPKPPVQHRPAYDLQHQHAYAAHMHRQFPQPWVPRFLAPPDSRDWCAVGGMPPPPAGVAQQQQQALVMKRDAAAYQQQQRHAVPRVAPAPMPPHAMQDTQFQQFIQMQRDRHLVPPKGEVAPAPVAPTIPKPLVVAPTHKQAAPPKKPWSATNKKAEMSESIEALLSLGEHAQKPAEADDEDDDDDDASQDATPNSDVDDEPAPKHVKTEPGTPEPRPSPRSTARSLDDAPSDGQPEVHVLQYKLAVAEHERDAAVAEAHFARSLLGNLRTCVVCFDKPRNCVFSSCGHFIICASCAEARPDRANDANCPYCARANNNNCDRATTHAAAKTRFPAPA